MADTKFKPGNPGGGRRKGKLMYEALMVALKRIEPSDTDPKRTAFQAVADNLVWLALQKDGTAVSAIREVMDRTDGKAVAAVDLTVNDYREIRDLTDDELRAVIKGDGGGGIVITAGGEGGPDRVH